MRTPDLKAVGHGVYLFAGKTPEQQAAAWERFAALARAGKVVSAWAVENGLAESVMKMSTANEIGFAAENTVLDWFAPMPGAIVAELSDEVSDAVRIGITTAEKAIALGADSASIEELAALNDAVLEAVYPTKTRDSGTVESFPMKRRRASPPPSSRRVRRRSSPFSPARTASTTRSARFRRQARTPSNSSSATSRAPMSQTASSALQLPSGPHR